MKNKRNYYTSSGLTPLPSEIQLIFSLLEVRSTDRREPLMHAACWPRTLTTSTSLYSNLNFSQSYTLNLSHWASTISLAFLSLKWISNPWFLHELISTNRIMTTRVKKKASNVLIGDLWYVLKRKYYFLSSL